MTITVLDVGDEAPVFKQHLYEASVKENRGPGEFVTRVEATDRDSGNLKICRLGDQCEKDAQNCDGHHLKYQDHSIHQTRYTHFRKRLLSGARFPD